MLMSVDATNDIAEFLTDRHPGAREHPGDE